MSRADAMTRAATHRAAHAAASPWADFAPLLARVLLSLLFIYSGIGKLMGPEGTMAYIAKAGLPLPMLSYAMALVVELGVATALLLGWRTREAAAVMAVFSVMSALMFHNQFGDKGQLVQLLKNLAIAGGFVQLMLAPVARWSLDARR
ncbi:DoxX family protein [Delftia acidovorans]|uniref:DoxX family protein n=2 Tax=Delftia acidovorans TaxID=80866 RepID=UPI001CD7F5E4|nr:DoxX family protein [Delftia acidovorans]